VNTNRRSFRAARAPLLLLAAASLFACSCSRSDQAAVSPVRGQVFTPRATPAAGALVVFHPVAAEHDTPLKPLAYVDEQGNFELTTYNQGDGAPSGEYVITVEWREKPATPFSANQEGKDRLRGKYADPASSQFRFTVDGESEHVVPAIHLE
jgi:hypothetical protein